MREKELMDEIMELTRNLSTSVVSAGGRGSGSRDSILHGGGRRELDPETKALVVAGVCGSGWVTGQPPTLTLYLSLAFFSSCPPSISLLNGEEDPRGTMAFFCPHYHPGTSVLSTRPLLRPTLPSFCFGLQILVQLVRGLQGLPIPVRAPKAATSPACGSLPGALYFGCFLGDLDT
ncbi:unnamed protein product [Pleuronectes platessa]|uniref:Uncharacterized protein n=1 Tax=Pleuronectes platessa TaxID=8262 RepID=A0A9N7VYU7_PLEPL|nr:unnamed protein product [Pleuronectes platessa]